MSLQSPDFGEHSVEQTVDPSMWRTIVGVGRNALAYIRDALAAGTERPINLDHAMMQAGVHDAAQIPFIRGRGQL